MLASATMMLHAGPALFGLPGHWEVIIILLLILLLFGGKKLPEMARGLARGLRSFKDELKGVKTDVEGDEDERKPAESGEEPSEPDKGKPSKKDEGERQSAEKQDDSEGPSRPS
jgi:sec-independent protein translocase protein TatA